MELLHFEHAKNIISFFFAKAQQNYLEKIKNKRLFGQF